MSSASSLALASVTTAKANNIAEQRISTVSAKATDIFVDVPTPNVALSSNYKTTISIGNPEAKSMTQTSPLGTSEKEKQRESFASTTTTASVISLDFTIVKINVSPQTTQGQDMEISRSIN